MSVNSFITAPGDSWQAFKEGARVTRNYMVPWTAFKASACLTVLFVSQTVKERARLCSSSREKFTLNTCWVLEFTCQCYEWPGWCRSLTLVPLLQTGLSCCPSPLWHRKILCWSSAASTDHWYVTMTDVWATEKLIVFLWIFSPGLWQIW